MVDLLLPLLIKFAAHTVLLTVMLWIMIKVQKLDYNFPGLIGSAVLGGGLDMIPLVGHPLAVVTLYFCIWKMTRASMFPDAAFTVVVAYALMFAFNMFVFTALIGDLRPDLHPSRADEPDDTTNQTVQTTPATTAQPDSKTPAPAAPAADSKARILAKHFTIKGLTRNGDKSSVAILCGEKNYFVPFDQTTLISTDDGIASVRLTALGDKSLTLEVNGEPMQFPAP